MFIFLIFLLVSSVLVEAAPYKSKNKEYDGPQLVYDQKQTGDYNIQLHLKDFQIIAMLGDDVLGDYDYNYDYADFTIKPTGSVPTSTTPKPTSSSPPPSTTQKEQPSTSQVPISISSTSEPNVFPSDLLLPETESSSYFQKFPSITHPYPIEVIVPQSTKKPTEDPQSIKRKVVLLDGNTEDPHSSLFVDDISSSHNLTLETTLNLSSSNKPSFPPQGSSVSPVKPSFTSASLPEPSPTPESAAGQIKVQILEAPSSTKIGSHSVGIVPERKVKGETNGSILQSELSSYRKCSTGYARDKRGRCRRVKRPGNPSQMPFDFSRLASNLATRLRLPPQETPKVTVGSIE